MFVLKYEAGYDRLDSTYQTVGGYVNVGFQLENVLKGESPFTAPTPIFRSPRNLSYMAEPTSEEGLESTRGRGCRSGCWSIIRDSDRRHDWILHLPKFYKPILLYHSCTVI